VDGYEKNGHLEEKTKKVLEYVNTCQQFAPNNIEYRFFSDSVKELSGAVLVGLNLISEEDKSKTTFKAVSGAPEILSQAMNTFGFNLEGTEWEVKYKELKISEKNKLIYFPSFKEIGYYNFLPHLAPVLKTIEKLLLPGGLYAMEFDYQGEFLGLITLIMPRGKVLENKQLVELYINQIASTIKRLRAENKLQQKVNALQESEAKFRSYMEKSPLGIFVADNEGHYIEVNRAACQMSGYTEEELLNLTIPDFIAPEFLEKGMESFERLLTEGYVEDEIMVRKKNGETFWINLAAVSADNNIVIAFCQDITKRKQTEEALKFKNIILKTQQEVSLDGILVVNEKVEIVSFNQRFADIWEIPGEIMASQSGQKALDYVLPKLVDPEEFVNLINYLNKNKQEKSYKEIALKDGKILELYSAPMFGRDGRYYGRVYYYRDITERKDAEEKIRYLSFHDGLTGLYNRVYLEKEMERLDTERQLPIGIIMADINGLKLANDTFGHEVGDEMLKQTAEILRSSCRREDIIARWGGDEFVIFLPQTTEEDAKAICQRIDEKCKETYVKDIPLSLALGTAIKYNTNKDLAEILKVAEENMYKHKRAESQRMKSNVLNVTITNAGMVQDTRRG